MGNEDCKYCQQGKYITTEDDHWDISVKNSTLIFWQDEFDKEVFKVNFCPMCGVKLK